GASSALRAAQATFRQSLLDESLADGLGHGLRPTPRAQLVLDVADEALDRPLRVGQLRRDLLRRLAGGEQPEDLEAALVEAARLARGAVVAHPQPCGRGTNRGDELLRCQPRERQRRVDPGG